MASYLYKGMLNHSALSVNVPQWASLGQISSATVPVVSGGAGAHTLVERLPVAVLTLDGAARVQYANAQAARLLGTARENLIGRSFARVQVVAEEQWRFTSALQSALGGTAESIVLHLACERGSRKLASVHLLPGETPGFVHLVLLDLTDQSEMETALHQSETLYDTFLEQSPIGLVHLDATGTITFENHRFRQIVGEGPEDAWVGLNAFRIPGLDGLFAVVIKRLLNAQQIQDFGVQYRAPGKPLRHLLLSGSPIRRENGSVSGAVLMVQDVTSERARAAEEALRGRYARAEAALREAVLAGDDEGAFLREASRIFAQTTGADRAAVLLPRVGQEAHLVSRAAWGERAEALAALRLDLETSRLPGFAPEAVVRLGASSHAEPFTDADETVLVPFYAQEHFEGAVLLDRFEGEMEEASDPLLLHLTRLFETLWSWLRTTRRYRLTVATMEDSLLNFVFEPDGSRRFLFLTPQITRMTGEATFVFVETPGAWAALPADDDARAALHAHDARLRDGMESEATFRIHHADGTERWLRERAVPHRDEADGLSVVGILSDVTGQKRAEHVLFEARKNAENASRDKTAFIATLSHEIRTPLGTISGFAELLAHELSDYEQQAGTPLPAQIGEFVTTIRERAAQTLTLVGDIFDLANLEAGGVRVEHAEIVVNDLVTEVASRYAPVLSEKGVALHLDLDSANPRVDADGQRLRQIVDNLLSNAVKFTSEGRVTLRTRKEEESVDIEVLDSGVGMSEAFQERLFTPFLQEDQRLNRDFDGIGLGLSLVKRLVDLLGGRIAVASRKGGGTTFRVSLPAVHA